MSVPRQPMTDFVEMEPLLVYRQEGRGRAPRLAPWNATKSRQLPVPLFRFPSRPSSCEPGVETSPPAIVSGVLAAETTSLSPHAARGLTPTTENLPRGSSVQEQQSKHEPSLHETNPNAGLPGPRRSPSISPKGKHKRKRVHENSSPGSRTKAQDRRGLSPEHNGEQESAEVGSTPPSSSNSTSPKAPSFSLLTSRSGSSMDLGNSIPVDLPIDLHEDPWHYDPDEHRFAREITHLRLWNGHRRNVNVNGASVGLE